MSITILISTILILLFIASIWFALTAEDAECPREMLGYKCRYGKCDHSAKTRDMARITLERNKEWNRLNATKK